MGGRILGQLLETQQGLYCVDPRDQWVTKQLFETGNYNPSEISRYSMFIPKKASMLWLGSHIGALVIPMSAHLGNIVAFEANPHTFKLFEANLALNKCQNIIAHNLAANHENGEIEFVLNTKNSGGSKRMPAYRHPVYFEELTEVVKVKAVNLDDFLFNQSFDAVFMDIEGSEYFAMKGMPRILSKASVVICEFITHHLQFVAGVTVSQFLEPLSAFRTMLAPSKNIVLHDGEILIGLEKLMQENWSDAGLIFFRDHVDPQIT